MSSMLKSSVVAAVSIALVLCAALARNSNANLAKSAAVAPTSDELLALDKQATEAYINGKGQFFEGLLSEKIVMTKNGRRMNKADVIKMISGVRCNIRDWSLTEPHMQRINDDTYVLSYKAMMEGTCTSGGKTDQPPTPVRAATVWIRSGEKWQVAFHGENLIVDPQTLSETYKNEHLVSADSGRFSYVAAWRRRAYNGIDRSASIPMVE